MDLRKHGSRRAVLIIIIGALFSLPLSAANRLYISARDAYDLGGVHFSPNTVAQYALEEGTASLYLNPQSWDQEMDIDALHILKNGHFIVSGFRAGQLAGRRYDPGDLVEYDPVADRADIYFDHRRFSQPANIDAVHVREDDGHLFISTSQPARLGGLNFTPGDVVEYDPRADTAQLFLDHRVFAGPIDIDGLHIRDNGNIVLSSDGPGQLAGLAFGPGDLVEYNRAANKATILLNRAQMGSNLDNDIDTIYINNDDQIILPYSSGGEALILAAPPGGYGISNGLLAEPSGVKNNTIMVFNSGGNINAGGGGGETPQYNNPENPSHPVPEPATMVLLGLGGTLWLLRHRHSHRRTAA